MTNWLESSPNSAEHLESLQEMATGSRDKRVEGMCGYLMHALEVPMPDDLELEEMFGHLETQLLARQSSGGDIYGPEK